MGNHTVNKKEEFIERAADMSDKTKITSVALQNNKPHKLEIAVTNSKEAKNLPFMIENGDLVADTDVAVVIRAEDNKEMEHDRY